jgi:hypothetical protein
MIRARIATSTEPSSHCSKSSKIFPLFRFVGEHRPWWTKDQCHSSSIHVEPVGILTGPSACFRCCPHCFVTNEFPMGDMYEVVIEKCDDLKANMIAAHANLCARCNQSILPRMDESFFSEDREIVRTADAFHGQYGNRFRGWPISAINPHIRSESDKQRRDIRWGAPGRLPGAKIKLDSCVSRNG